MVKRQLVRGRQTDGTPSGSNSPLRPTRLRAGPSTAPSTRNSTSLALPSTTLTMPTNLSRGCTTMGVSRVGNAMQTREPQSLRGHGAGVDAEADHRSLLARAPSSRHGSLGVLNRRLQQIASHKRARQAERGRCANHVRMETTNVSSMLSNFDYMYAYLAKDI